MKRIIDADLNRATEALRVIEEISRFNFNDREISEELKFIRHELCSFFDKDYDKLLIARNTVDDIGTNIKNPTKLSSQVSLEGVLRANFKRLEQALRVLSEFASLDDEYRYKVYTIEKKMNERLKMDIKKYILQDKKLYLVTNSDNFDSDEAFMDKIALAIKSGVDIVQLREKKKPASKIMEYGKVLRHLCSEYNSLFIVNDRIDIALALEADGVHLGQDDIDIKTARKMLGSNSIIGISTHKPQDAIEALKGGADYIGVGPVFKTPTKPGRVPVGLEYVKWASENIDIPFFAIGAINLNNVDEVISSGANRIAVVREIMNSSNVEETVKKLKKKIS